MQFLINNHHYSSVTTTPNSGMMSAIDCIPFVIIVLIAKNLVSCLPRCSLTFVSLSPAATIVPVDYPANPKSLTIFIFQP